MPFTLAATTSFVVTGTDAFGCSATDTVVVTALSLPNVSAGGNQTTCEGDSVTLSGSGASSYSWDNGITDGVSFIASATTTYTVTGTGVNGCTNTDYATITVNPNPSVDAGNNQTLCEGNSITLNASGASSYLWDNGVVDGVQLPRVLLQLIRLLEQI